MKQQRKSIGDPIYDPTVLSEICNSPSVRRRSPDSPHLSSVPEFFTLTCGLDAKHTYCSCNQRACEGTPFELSPSMGSKRSPTLQICSIGPIDEEKWRLRLNILN